MLKRDFHVLRKGGDWVVEREAGGKEAGPFTTRGEAESHARDLAKRERVELVVYDAKGDVAARECYFEGDDGLKKTGHVPGQD